MSRRRPTVWIMIGCAALWAVLEGNAQTSDEPKPGEPIWVEWMATDDPDDQTILHFWDLYQQDELGAASVVDLATMLFRRGFPDDAVRMYRQALHIDSRLFEAWFRIGLVRFHQEKMDDARNAMKRCLKIEPGYGWCNFYLGLVEERTHHPSKALKFYERAFASTPKLADPNVNPDLLHSRLSLVALLAERNRRPTMSPIPRSDQGPAAAKQDHSRSRKPSREPSAGPSTDAPVQGATPTEPEFDVLTSGSTSPEASLDPIWSSFPEWILALL